MAKIDEKATKVEVDQLRHDKANKIDAEMAIRQIQIIHRQLKQVSLLLSLKMKQSLEKKIESQHHRENKKVSLLYQSLMISQWI